MKNPFQVNKILIPIDLSDTSKLAFEHAAYLCQKFGSSLHLLHVYKTSSVDVLPNLTATSPVVSNAANLKAMVTEELDLLGKEFSDKYNVAYNIEVREGSVAKEIIETAKEVKADLIVMGTHGMSGFEEFFIGSNSYRVVTSSSIPVLTVQQKATKMGFENIVLPIDNSPHTRDKVSQAVAIAKTFNSKIHIAALIREENEEDQKIFNLKVRLVEEHLDHNEIQHETRVLHGENIAEMTLTFAEAVKGDLTIIMTDQENYTGFLVGPYAQRIVNHSKTPVLSVTPIGTIEGFSQDQLGGASNPF
ncbi:MAG: universal stress protein [Flavobacteriales bacterium]|nr:universal stress protein [Flavobacteriales bacterium]